MNHTLYKNIVLSLVVAFLTVHSSLAQAGKAVWPSSVQFDLDTIVLPALPQKVAQQNAGDYARLKSLIFAHPFLVGYTPFV